MLPETLHIGSVKNILGKIGDSEYYFDYSDRYSVFDWGAMPDVLEDKGNVLAQMADFFFEYLGKSDNWRNWKPQDEKLVQSATYDQFQTMGVAHHGLGMVNSDLEKTNNSNIYKVKAVNVIRPKSTESASGLIYDYAPYLEKVTNALVPLEVIFRFGVPEGSSLLKRVKDAEYLSSLGLEKEPVVGDMFDSPVVEFSTKLENVDRYINYAQAKEIAGLSDSEVENLVETVKLLALRMKDIFKGINIELWDGKFEFAFAPKIKPNGDRIFMLVDSIGPDELRLTYDGTQLSKECLRKFYRGGQWEENVEKSKKLADERGVADWKTICIDELGSTPQKLDSNIKLTVEMMYKSLLNDLKVKYLGEPKSENIWSLEKVSTSLKEILNG